MIEHQKKHDNRWGKDMTPEASLAGIENFRQEN